MTNAQRNIMAEDRAEEILAILEEHGITIPCEDVDVHEQLQQFVLDNYDADRGAT